MYFAQGVWEGFSGLWATHPPLKKRIRAIDPDWNGQFPAARPADTSELAGEFAGAGSLGFADSSELDSPLAELPLDEPAGAELDLADEASIAADSLETVQFRPVSDHANEESASASDLGADQDDDEFDLAELLDDRGPIPAELDLPIGVVRVLVGDLVESELVHVNRPVPPAELPDESILRDVINGLRAL